MHCFFKVVSGEAAPAFYTATIPSDQTITGISTYTVIPFEAGQYFNKTQVRRVYVAAFSFHVIIMFSN